RQGTCLLPIVIPLAWLFAANGGACTQGVADILTILHAVPILRRVLRMVREAEETQAAETSAQTVKEVGV
ncbi:MAG: hypothetical protein LUC27_01600, partial [Lachnospiraceae bacterium]|nr:hypothetical protein [Lachnospiraceae bacterium]